MVPTYFEVGAQAFWSLDLFSQSEGLLCLFCYLCDLTLRLHRKKQL